MSSRDDIIRASEIGEYAYCARAWWLKRVKGQRSANTAAMGQGTARHRRHGQQVESYYLRHWLARIVLLLAIVMLLAGLILVLRGGG